MIFGTKNQEFNNKLQMITLISLFAIKGNIRLWNIVSLPIITKIYWANLGELTLINSQQFIIFPGS